MDFIGNWRIKLMRSDFAGQKICQDIEEEYLKAEGEEKHEKEQLYNMRYNFKEDGTVVLGMILSDSVTDEQIAEAVAQGEQIEGRLYICETKLWKKENGKLFSQVSADTEHAGLEHEFDGSEFGEVKFEDDMMVINAVFGEYCLVKVD